MLNRFIESLAYATSMYKVQRRNYLKIYSGESSPHMGSEKNTFALSLSKGISPPTPIVSRQILITPIP